MFAYLKKHHDSEMVFDPSKVDMDLTDFGDQDWSFLQYGCKEMKAELPDNMPVPLDHSFRIKVYVDSDHAGNMLMQQSRTGFVVLLNNAPIYWFSERQGCARRAPSAQSPGNEAGYRICPRTLVQAENDGDTC